MFSLLFKVFSPATGKAFGLLLLASVVAIIWYGSDRIDSLKLENHRLDDKYEAIETELMGIEQRFDDQQQAIGLVLQSQVSIRQSIAQQKSQIKKQTGERQHAAKENPDALGTTVTDSLADIMQQFKATTSYQAIGSNNTATPYPH